ncbi:MAG: HD domain-containing protein [Sphingobacteriia bacterium]|jgi:phosphonate degradation associated HDIG domain protein|nr:MAG: HD domain-containing protein [Sphingobacteriia bacterium]TAG30363.1 MAG: HD domain-containing protein [Sphingobacteriia bacterium]TAH08187.1 MAG: HD domain-containing protein [Sphingobacteriia bacterium]
MQQEETIQQSVTEIMDMYKKFGDEDYVGEPVSQIEHMCQCAELAREAGSDDELILAAFLHDIGHLYALAFPEVEINYMDGFGIVDHEKIGGAYLLSKGFAPSIAKMVASHVEAKRYLTYSDSSYYHLLSEASKKTLEFQGGKMTEMEALAFEADPLHTNYIILRKWDEMAKMVNMPLPEMGDYEAMMIKHLSHQKSNEKI